MLKRKKINPNTTDTLIGEGTSFEGTLTSKAGIRIEGTVTGRIQCDGDVIIGKSGEVAAEVVARNITISGKVTGNVEVKETITLHSEGSLIGDLVCSSISIQEGAVFTGNSTMTRADQQSTSKSSSRKQDDQEQTA